MHAGSRICLGKLRMSTCEGPAEDRARLPFVDLATRNGTRRVTGTCVPRVHRPCRRARCLHAYCALTFATVFY